MLHHDDVRDVADEELRGLSPERRALFHVRLERRRDDLIDALTMLYGAEVARRTAIRLVGAAARAYRERDDDLHLLDLHRTHRPDWLQEPSMIGYACYVDRFAGDLRGMADRLAELQDLGVTYLHLMPLMAGRSGDDDGGYAVADFEAVRPDLGTIDDLCALTRRLRAAGISPVVDLVLNHVADEHDWVTRARSGDARYRAYFHIYPDRTAPDAYEESLPEVFPDFAPGNFTWDDAVAGWVWTTFNAFQWDLDWSNPDVLAEFAGIVLRLANRGVEVLRLDAIAFTWKRLGTDCQNQPEVHALTQALRTVARIACPAVAFKAEAIVGPTDLVPYLGAGAHVGKVSDMAYHNALMVQVWSMMAAGDTRLAVQALGSLPPTPSSATWATYLRCHDDIGWAVADEDAAAVGWDGASHRAFLSDWYAGAFPGSTARGAVFQHNPVTGDRRISGTAASLLGLESALDDGDETAVDLALRRLRAASAIVVGWGGIPIVWSGDEHAALNDPHWADEPGHSGDNRWMHRPRHAPQWTVEKADPASPAGRAHRDLAHLLRVRAGLPHLHASVATIVGDVDDPGVFVTYRRHPLGTLVGLYNVTAQWRMWPSHRLDACGFARPLDVLSGSPPHRGDDGNLWIEPYGVAWIVDGPST